LLADALILQIVLTLGFCNVEIKELQKHFKAKIYQFPRGKEEIGVYKDGGVAIIDQWIAAHARYIGFGLLR